MAHSPFRMLLMEPFFESIYHSYQRCSHLFSHLKRCFRTQFIAVIKGVRTYSRISKNVLYNQFATIIRHLWSARIGANTLDNCDKLIQKWFHETRMGYLVTHCVFSFNLTFLPLAAALIFHNQLLQTKCS